jgi:hypothetical protein
LLAFDAAFIQPELLIYIEMLVLWLLMGEAQGDVDGHRAS